MTVTASNRNRNSVSLRKTWWLHTIYHTVTRTSDWISCLTSYLASGPGRFESNDLGKYILLLTFVPHYHFVCSILWVPSDPCSMNKWPSLFVMGLRGPLVFCQWTSVVCCESYWTLSVLSMNLCCMLWGGWGGGGTHAQTLLCWGEHMLTLYICSTSVQCLSFLHV